MNDDSVLCLRQVVPASSVTDSCRLVMDGTADEYLVIAMANVISFRRVQTPMEVVHSERVAGTIIRIIPVANMSQLLVLSSSRGIFNYSIVSGPPRVTEILPITALPSSLGARLPVPIFSNHVNGVVALQTREGSLYIFRKLDSSSPAVTRFDLPKSSGRNPILSMSLFERSQNDFCLITVSGDPESSTPQLGVYSIRDHGKLSLDLVTNPPKPFQTIANDLKPFFTCADEYASNAIFIGGDCESYSAIGSYSISQLFRPSDNSAADDFKHCQPVPHPKVANLNGQFFISSSFGELYSFSARKGLTLLRSKLPISYTGASTLTTLSSSHLFIGSSVGDSLLVALSNSSAPPESIVRSTAPIFSFEKKDIDAVTTNSITTIGGIGTSASISRIITSGIANHTFDMENVSTSSRRHKPTNLVMLGRNHVAVSTPISSRIYRIEKRQDSSSLLLTEISLSVPRNIISAFTRDSKHVVIASDGLYVIDLSSNGGGGIVSQTWKCPNMGGVTACCYDNQRRLVVVVSGTSVYLLMNEKQISQLQLFQHEEITCVALRGNRSVFGLDQSQSIVVIEDMEDGGGKRRRTIYKGDSIPHSIMWLNDDHVCVGFRNGSVMVISISGGEMMTMELSGGGVMAASLSSFDDTKNFISGDKPAFIKSDDSNNVERIDLVNASSGTVDVMKSIQAIDDHTLIYIDGQTGEIRASFVELGKTKEVHVQRSHLEMFSLKSNCPLLVGIERVGKSVIVGVTDTVSPNDYLCVLEDKNWSSKMLNKISLPKEQRLSCFAIGCVSTEASHDLGDEICVLGTALEESGHEPIEGRLILITLDSLLTSEGIMDASFVTIFSQDMTGPAGPVTGLKIVNGYVIATAGRTVSVYKRGGLNSLVFCASLDTDYFITSIDAIETVGSSSQIQILTGDVSRSVTLIEFTNNVLTIVGKDWTPAYVTAVAFINSEKFVFGDNVENLYIGGLLDRPSERIERIQGICLGTIVSALERVGNKVIIGTKNGSVFELVQRANFDDSFNTNDQTLFGPPYDPNRDQSHIPVLLFESV